jgi:peptidoglycan/LPS O-acetylase OafA/YrhL
MSLAPAERRALDGIEGSLRRSDPRLARILTRFSLPLFRGGLAILARRLRRPRLAIVSALAVAAVAVLVVAALHTPEPPVPCAAAATSGLLGPGAQASACLSLQHESITGQNSTSQTVTGQSSVGQTSTTGWPVNQGTP